MFFDISILLITQKARYKVNTLLFYLEHHFSNEIVPIYINTINCSILEKNEGILIYL